MIDVTIVGSGPAGLACAIEAQNAGLSHLVLEQGGLTDAIRRFPVTMTFFSTPELLEIGGVPFITSTFRPSRIDSLRYYERVASKYSIQIQYQTYVSTIEKKPGGFVLSTSKGLTESRYVVVATGYFDVPNPFNVPGVDLAKVSRYYSEPFQYFNRNVALVGGKNSVVDAALELFRHGARVTIIHRGPKLSDGVKYWLLPDIENRIKANEIQAFFSTRVKEIHAKTIKLEGEHAGEIVNDYLFVLIGYRPDVRILESAGVHIDAESLAPIFDPQSMETNVPGVFVAGSIASGKYNNRIFIENGRLHGKIILDAIVRK